MLLKRAIAPYGYDLELNARATDYNNVLSVARGESVLGITMPQFVDWSQRGLDVFASEKIPELRVIAALNLPVWLAAAVDRASGLTSLAELVAARYPWRVVMPDPHNLVAVYIDRILREHGATREAIVGWGGADLRPTLRLSPEERARHQGPLVMNHQTARLARSGEANGFFLYVNGNSTWARDLTVLRDLRFLRFEETILDRINAEWGGTTITLPERLFAGVDENLPVVGWRHQYVYGPADVPDDLAIAVLRALEDERILDNAHGFSYAALRPKLVGALELHRAADAWYRAREPR
jgi:hypothetical protein